MWFEDYDEYMMFKDAMLKAKAKRRTSFEYDDHIYSMDMAEALTNTIDKNRG